VSFNKDSSSRLIDVNRLSRRFFYHVKSKYESIMHESLANTQWKNVKFSKNVIDSITNQLSAQLEHKNTSPSPWQTHEQAIIQHIQKQTDQLNTNNITRTEAYRQIYLRNPELHWAFLAHMVSRNGGWSMTDLKGDLLPHILDVEQIKHFFRFLERSNALIFQDAYPQLLLYVESKKQQKNLFHLLPAFDVSRFMKPFWDHFWESKNSQLLTIALIINEQYYIEERVVQHPLFKKYVFNTLAFKAQAMLQLTQVIFPYSPKKRHPFLSSRLRLAGFTLSEFSNLEDRINMGKKLYVILFGIKDVYEGALHFAEGTPHSGSRADFWPHIYTGIPNHSDNKILKERLIGCKLKKHASPFYSPELEQVWKNYPLLAPEKFDWFTDLSAIEFLQSVETPSSFDITNSFCLGLKKIELSIVATVHVKKEIYG
jgi:hypothetical protein